MHQKIALVTGGSRGLGRSTAIALARAGRSMARELCPRRIPVNVIAPGAIETDVGGGVVRDDPELNPGIAEQAALGRVGLPDDIAGAIASLLWQENRWINGRRIDISGGIFL